MPKEIPALDAQTLALLKERRAMHSATPSVLPELHRRMRVAAMERTSLRDALRHSLERVWDRISEITAPAGLGYAGACAAVALALVFGFQQSHSGSGAERFLTLREAPAAAPAVQPIQQYAFNDTGALSQPAAALGQMAAAPASDLNQDSAQHAAGAHYVLTNAPTSYDSVVAF